MKNPLLFYAAYHVWLSDDSTQREAPNKIVQRLVEFVRPHFDHYKSTAARHRLTLQDIVDSHGTMLKKRSDGHVDVVRQLI